MDLSRRDVTLAGAVALSVSYLALGGSAGADSGDEAAVAQRVETLRQGLLEANKAKLEEIAAPQISYGHSDGRVETKEQFAAIARHIYLSESELDGKATTTRIGALQVWQKQDGE